MGSRFSAPCRCCCTHCAEDQVRSSSNILDVETPFSASAGTMPFLLFVVLAEGGGDRRGARLEGGRNGVHHRLERRRPAQRRRRRREEDGGARPVASHTGADVRSDLLAASHGMIRKPLPPPKKKQNTADLAILMIVFQVLRSCVRCIGDVPVLNQ